MALAVAGIVVAVFSVILSPVAFTAAVLPVVVPCLIVIAPAIAVPVPFAVLAISVVAGLFVAVGGISTAVFLCGAVAQLTIGRLLEKCLLGALADGARFVPGEYLAFALLKHGDERIVQLVGGRVLHRLLGDPHPLPHRAEQVQAPQPCPQRRQTGPRRELRLGGLTARGEWAINFRCWAFS